jgi:hypothetical protein
MGRNLISLLSFNRGLVSRLGLARIDLKRLALSAEVMTNWMPRVLGSMSLRPGLQYLGSTKSNSAARFLPFVFSTTDTALLELTNLTMRVWVNDAVIQRPAVVTSIVNGGFAADLSGWTQSDEAGGTSSWVAPNYMQLASNGTAAAIRDQQVTVLSPNIEHGLHITIARGPVTLRVGSVQGDDAYVRETVLQAGTHSLALTPSSNFWIRFMSRQIPVVWVSGCTIEPAGDMQLPTPWATSEISSVRIDQSADVIFAACVGHQQRRIERRATRSWSVALYVTPDGPFKIQNVTPTTIAASATTGNVNLTASTSIFRNTHIGALFSLTSASQNVSASIVAQNVFTSPIRVIGVGTTRTFLISVGNTFVATAQLQASVGSSSGPWNDVVGVSWAAPFTGTYVDGLANQIMYYRIGVKTAQYTSGQVDVSLSIATGSITGVGRITGYASPTLVTAEVIQAFGDTAPTTTWAEGSWSDFRGWPTGVALHEGRMWWAGQGTIYGSISDAFNSFDSSFFGDAGTIQRSIGSGPVDTINWILSLQRMILGGQGSEYSVRSSSLDTPLTPADFMLKAASTQGSGNIKSIKIDQRGMFINRSGAKLFGLEFSLKTYDYTASDLMALVPEIGMPGIIRMDSHRQPDTRIHCVRSDGIAIVMVNDATEDVEAWVQVQTDGIIEDVVTLPALNGNLDDQVYYVVNRTINGSTVRYLEKWAQEVDCRGDKQLCNLADSFSTYTGVPNPNITGLSHLEGKKVVVWADGFDVGTDDTVVPWVQRYTVTGGQITLAVPASNVTVGLPYTGQFKSAKLGAPAQGIDSPLNMQKRINHLGLILADVHPKGLQYGPEFIYLDDMPMIEDGTLVGPGMRSSYDENTIEFPGEWVTDQRLCLQAQAPRPCTVLAATIDAEIYK